tara:strand:- start:394 stop:537 length:144 start_codon:yes stop_codon:yes gene_type:complete
MDGLIKETLQENNKVLDILLDDVEIPAYYINLINKQQALNNSAIDLF